MKNLQNWFQLSAIQIGGVICLPVIMIGQTLSQTYGFFSAVVSIIIGNAVLFLLSLITVKMSLQNRKTTMENAQEYFGKKGTPFFAVAMVLSLVGWFGIQLNMMSLGVCDLLSLDKNGVGWPLALNLSLGLAMTYVALHGMKGIAILANLALPFLLATIAYAVCTVDPNRVEHPPIEFSIGGASLVIALAIALIVDLPTYYRHARTEKDGFISTLIIFVLVLPALEIVGVYLALGISEGNILDILRRENSPLWNSWISLFLVLAGWTTNNINLYSSVISLQVINKSISQQRATLLLGLAGTMLSCFDLLGHFSFALNLMGVCIGSMGAVILTRYVVCFYFGIPLNSKDYLRRLFAWAFGASMGLLSIQGYSWTSIELLDAVIGASLGTLLTLNRQETYEEA